MSAGPPGEPLGPRDAQKAQGGLQRVQGGPKMLREARWGPQGAQRPQEGPGEQLRARESPRGPREAPSVFHLRSFPACGFRCFFKGTLRAAAGRHLRVSALFG